MKKILIGIAVLVACALGLLFVYAFLVCVMMGNHPTYEEKVQMREARYQEEWKNCNTRIGKNAQDAEEYFARGKLYANKTGEFDHQDLPKAVEDFTKAIELNSEKGEYFRCRGEVYEALSRKADMRYANYESERSYGKWAELDYIAATQRDAKDIDAFLRLGKLALHQEKPPQEALAYFDQAMKLLMEMEPNPQNRQYDKRNMVDVIHKYRTMIFLILGDESAAAAELKLPRDNGGEARTMQEMLDKRRELDPSGEKTLYAGNAEGLRFAETGDYLQAVKCYSDAIARIPFDWRDESNDDLEIVLNKASFGRIYLNRARANAALGRETSAMEDYRCAVGKSPILRNEVPEAYRQYLIDYKQEVIDCNRRIASGERSSAVYFQQGMAYYILQRYNLAREDFDVVTEEKYKKLIPKQYPW